MRKTDHEKKETIRIISARQAIRMSLQLVATLRQMAAKRGKPYQRLIHELLEEAASQAA